MIDIVVGPQAYHRLPDLVAEAAAGRRAVDTDMPAISKFDALPARRRASPSAFLTVQEGCDKFCTYCVVPYTRGAEVSRPWADIVAEAHALVDAGALEIVLLGQNVNAWSDGDRGLDALIRALAQDRWPRAHPLHHQPPGRHDRRADCRAWRSRQVDALPSLARAVGQRPHPQGDEPQPFGRILSCKIIERVRAARPDIAISGDFIVGFPGESDEDFADTLALVEAVGYAAAYSFKYSPRPGTPAATMEGAIAT